MLELLLCSLFTILPDYLFRRYAQGKRFGRDITLYSVWYELRWGITSCLILAVVLITAIFYYHPSTKAAVSFFRTIPLLPESGGRVDEVYVGLRDKVKAGQRLFKLDSSKQDAVLESARRRVGEIDAMFEQAKADVAASEGRVQEARSSLRQAETELQTKVELEKRGAGLVAKRDIEKLQTAIEGRQGSLTAALASKQAIETQISTLLPAQKASAEAAVAEAQVEVDKTVVYAGVDGVLEQFSLRKGDVVNPMLRPAGILVPTEAGRYGLFAGFGQIEAQVMKVGMVGEVTCIAKPFTIIPMVITEVQDTIAAGQIRPTDQLIDPSQTARPGTITVLMEPLYEGDFDGVPPGSACIANAYTNNHDRLAAKDVGTLEWAFLHAIDALGVVHALILRLQALMLPVQTLVFAGH
jgi:multidrug resistance efflux pump